MRAWEQHANNLTKAIRWGSLEDKEVMPMRRIFLVLAVLALLTISAMPAMAQSWDRGHDDNNWWDRGHDNNRWDRGHNDDNWWDNKVWCNWFPSWHGWDYWCYSPWWGWWKLW